MSSKFMVSSLPTDWKPKKSKTLKDGTIVLPDGYDGITPEGYVKCISFKPVKPWQ